MPLRRQLRFWDLMILGVTGAVGTGVLFSNAGMAAVAGPGVVLAWIVGAAFYLFIGLTYVDLSVLYPEAGGPSRYSLYTHGRTTNLVNAFSDLIWYLFIPPIEALAASEGLNYFYPHMVTPSGDFTTVGALVGALLLLLFLPFNWFGIRAFRQSTNLFGSVKLLLYVLVAIGFLSFARFSNFHIDGFTPFGLAGVFSAIPFAMFAFGGIRVIPDYAEEVQDPTIMRRAIIGVVLGQTVIYVLFAVAFVVSLKWATFGLKPGNWASVTHLPGNPFLALASKGNIEWLLILTVIIAIVGPFVTGYIYQGAGSRVMLAMSRSGMMSRRLRDISAEHAIPAPALVAFTVVGIIAAYLAAPLPSIYSLISDAVVAGYIGFAVNPVAMIALRRNHIEGPVRSGGVVPVVAFGAASLIVFWNGWPAVPYAVGLLVLLSLAFGLFYKVAQDFRHAVWYMAWIVFLTGMTYIGSVGMKTVVSFYTGSLIVVVVSLVVFLPWGVRSRLQDVTTPQEAEASRPA